MTSQLSQQQLVKELREKTGVGILECRSALQEASWDLTKAVSILQKRGTGAAQKKSSRETRQGRVESYIHGDGRIGVLVELNCESDFVGRNEDFKRLAKDVSMQIAASSPSWVSRDEVTPQEIEPQIAQFKEEAKGKPAQIVEKIVEGKLEKFYQAHCLLEQPFIKNEDITVQEYLNQTIQKIGENIRIKRFVRFQLGG